MKKVELAEGVFSSVLGFGCAPIMGAVDAKTAKYALDFALDHGINHLDLARSYGYGDAEKYVGTVIKGKRDALVLASKFGIRANWKATLMKVAKPVVRMMRKQARSPVASVPAPPGNGISTRFLDRIMPIRGQEMRSSLETSLRALQTDHLDYFFVHEPEHRLEYIDELTETAEQLKEAGKIRAWGIAYLSSQRELHSLYLNRFDVLQFGSPTGAAEYAELVERHGARPNIVFSPIRGNVAEGSPVEKIRRLMDDFPKSVILCSMFTVAHIKQNIALVS